MATRGPSPYRSVFLSLARAVSDGLADFDHALYESGFRMVPAGGARSLVRVVEPYFERSHDRFSGHSYTPPGRLSRYSAIVLNRLEGGGAVITSSAPLFAAYGRHAVPEHRRLMGNCLALLLPRPLVRAPAAPAAPSVLETTVVRKGATTIVHLRGSIPCSGGVRGGNRPPRGPIPAAAPRPRPTTLLRPCSAPVTDTGVP